MRSKNILAFWDYATFQHLFPYRKGHPMTQHAPKISVLMPAYNVEKYVGTAIESIQNQTYSNFEFIIINDGSTDNTAKIINQYAKKDKRIKFINNSKNTGLIAVLNDGLKLCRGEYIARFDSDDIALPERFEKQIKYMDNHPECGVVGTWLKKFGPEIKPNDIYKYPHKMKPLDFVFHGNQVAHPSAMIRRSVIAKYSIKYDPKYKHAEDYAFWTEIVKHSEIHNLQEVLHLYRWYDNNVSVIHKKEQYDCAERIRYDRLSEILTSEHDINVLINISREINERFYLFGFLPTIRRKQYSTIKTKYYLFEKIPIIKEKDGHIYLFELIKIGSFK